jgi:hypothetical protein
MDKTAETDRPVCLVGLDHTFIGAFIWLYADTVNKTSLATRIAGLRTLATGKRQTVASVRDSDRRE